MIAIFFAALPLPEIEIYSKPYQMCNLAAEGVVIESVSQA